MKLLRLNPALLLLLGGFALFLVLGYARSMEGASAPAPAPVRPAAPPPAPSAENVDPGFHARIMTLEQRLAGSPNDTLVLLQLARLQQDAHQDAEAAAHYERYLALAPASRQPWLDLASVYAGLGRWDDAAGTMDRMLERFPNDPSARYNLGAIAANQGRFDEARRHWEAVRDQREDPALAAQAVASLARLGDVARPSTPTAQTASRRPLPPGHPVVARPVTPQE